MPARIFMRGLNHLEEILIGTLIAAATVLIFVAVVQRYALTNSITIAHWGEAHGYEWINQGGRAFYSFLQGVFRKRPYLLLTWAQELCIYLFIWMAKFGAAYGVRQGIHVGVDVLVNRIGEKARKPVILFALLSGALFTFTIGTFGSVFVYNMAGTDQISPDLELPMWLVYLAIPAGSYLMCFRFLQVAWFYMLIGEIPGHGHHAQVSVPGVGVTPDLETPGIAVITEGATQ
jgi:TRAP-type C4-dicarboxylate transport system permease small subunit